jgi:hypothetical protein
LGAGALVVSASASKADVPLHPVEVGLVPHADTELVMVGIR